MLFLARIVDGLSGGNISTARAYVADVTEPKDRARAYGLIGAAFGLGFIFGPALSGVLATVSYTAPIWAAAALTLVATVMAWFWLPETVHRAHGRHRQCRSAICRRCCGGRGCAACSSIDFVYWFAFAIFQTTFALFAARRFGFDASQTGYFFAAFGVLGAIVQGGFIRPIVQPARRQADVHRSAWSARPSAWSAATLTHSVALFALALVPLALGIGFGHPTMSSLVSRAGARRRAGTRAGRGERGRKPRPHAWARSGATRRSSGSAKACRTCRRPAACADAGPEPRLHRHRSPNHALRSGSALSLTVLPTRGSSGESPRLGRPASRCA